MARGIENGRKLVDASQNKGKPPNETEIRISKRGIASCIQASCVEAFDVALTRKYLGRGNDVRGLPGPVISTPRRKRILFQLENRFSPVEIKRGKRKGEAKPPFSLLVTRWAREFLIDLCFFFTWRKATRMALVIMLQISWIRF